MTIFLHIGLHKTASTFLQKCLFPNLDRSRICYNPPELNSSLRTIFRLSDAPENLVDYRDTCVSRAQALIKAWESGANGRTLLLSHEGFSQFDFAQDYDEHAALLKKIIPNANIIVFLRFQPDWLLSLYRQTVYVGEHQSISNFLNYRNGEFNPVNDIYNDRGLLQTNALGADWCLLIDAYITRYGRDNVHVFFFEDFISNRRQVIDELCDLLGVVPPGYAQEQVINRGLSALTIAVLIARFNILHALGLGVLLHTVYKERKRYYDKLTESLNDSGTQPINTMVRVVRSLRRRPKFLTGLPLLHKLMHPHFYVDWDLLAKHGLRQQLTAHYHERNRRLSALLSDQRIPAGYLR